VLVAEQRSTEWRIRVGPPARKRYLKEMRSCGGGKKRAIFHDAFPFFLEILHCAIGEKATTFSAIL
jgi:hypothetical protein